MQALGGGAQPGLRAGDASGTCSWGGAGAAHLSGGPSLSAARLPSPLSCACAAGTPSLWRRWGRAVNVLSTGRFLFTDSFIDCFCLRCRYAQFVEALESCSRDNLAFVKDRAVKTM